MAARALRGAPARTGTNAGPLRHVPPGEVRPLASPGFMRQADGSRGQPLSAETRAQLEPHFGWSFANVRVHTDPIAGSLAAQMGAQAFTVGRDIFFAQGRMDPWSPTGRLLLAHELAHVTQQADGRERGAIQAKPDAPAAKAKSFNFRVKVTRAMDPDELLREFIRQYYRQNSQQEVEKKIPLWHWQKSPGPSVSEDDARKGFKILHVTDHSQQQFVKLSQEEQKKVNDETDERFWAEEGLKPGTKLGNSPQDKEKAREWMGIRADVLLEKEESDAINALPDDIKKILFAGDRKVAPDDYKKILELANKLSLLTPAQRQDYISKINADTTSLRDMELAIDVYMGSQIVQEEEEQKTEESAHKLFLKEDLYKLWVRKKALRRKASAPHPSPRYRDMGFDPEEYRQEADEAEAEFTKALKENHFDSEKDFVDSMEAYRLRFRAEAVHIAMEILARYENKLFLARKKYQNPANAAALVKNIGATQAKAHYAEASSKSTAATVTRVTAPDDFQGASEAGQQAAELDAQSKKLTAQAEGEVIQASGNDPLIDPGQLGKDTDREKLAGLNPAEAQQYMLQVIGNRYDDLAKARAEFTSDPDRIFSQQPLVDATKQSLHVEDNTIYAWIVRDYIEDQRMSHIFSSIVLGILALILAALVPGGGWVAAAALLAGAAISTEQAVEAVQEYRKQGVEYRLDFIDKEPSLIWVVVAIAGAALDVGVALKASAGALRALEPELLAFSKAADAETAAAKLEALNAKIDAVAGMEQNIKNALKEKAAAELGLRKAIGKAAGTTFGSLGGAVDPTPVFEALYYGIKKGANSITALRNESEIMKLMGDVTKMSGAAKEELLTAFENVKKVIAIGRARGMDDATVLLYVDRLAADRAKGSAAIEAITEEMNAWGKPPAAPPTAKVETPTPTLHPDEKPPASRANELPSARKETVPDGEHPPEQKPPVAPEEKPATPPQDKEATPAADSQAPEQKESPAEQPPDVPDTVPSTSDEEKALRKDIKSLKAKKARAENTMNNQREIAKQEAERAAELRRRAAIEKDPAARSRMSKEAAKADEASRKALNRAEAARQKLIENQLELQKKQLMLNKDLQSTLPCFSEGTPVLTPSGVRPIDSLQPDDVVLAYDFASLRAVPRRVLKVHKNKTERFYSIRMKGDAVFATGLHRFWVVSEQRWVEARALKAGASLLGSNGESVAVESIAIHESPDASTYNLHVEQFSTYFVGSGVLVHNQGAPSYTFGDLLIYEGTNPKFPGKVYIGQTDDLARREGQHRAEAETNLGRTNLTPEERDFWEFKKDMTLKTRVTGLDKDQADYLEQTNKDLETKIRGEDNVMNRREQVSRKNMPALAEKIKANPKVQQAGLCR